MDFLSLQRPFQVRFELNSFKGTFFIEFYFSSTRYIAPQNAQKTKTPQKAFEQSNSLALRPGKLGMFKNEVTFSFQFSLIQVFLYISRSYLFLIYQPTMPKFSCKCGKSFKKQSLRLKCLDSHGDIKRTGAKRLDPVLSEQKPNEDLEQMDQQDSISHFNEDAKPLEPQEKSFSNTKTPLKMVTIVNPHFSRLRNSWRFTNVDSKVFVHDNFARQMKKAEQKEPNQLGKVIEQQRYYDHQSAANSYRKTYGKTKYIKMLTDLGQNKQEIIKAMENALIQQTLKAQVLPRKLQAEDFQQQKKKVITKCKDRIEEYLQSQDWKRKGKFCLSDARFQPVEALFQKINWQNLLKKQQKQFENRIEQQRIQSLSTSQLMMEIQKEAFFQRFRSLVFKRQVEMQLYYSDRLVTYDQNGNILRMNRVNLVPLKKQEREKTQQFYERQVKERFKALWYYFRFKLMFTQQVKQETDFYPSLCDEIRDYFLKQDSHYFATLFTRRLQQNLAEEQAEKIKKSLGLWSSEEQNRYYLFTLKFPDFRDLYKWFYRYKIIKNLKDLNSFLGDLLNGLKNYSASEKKIEDSTLETKLFLLNDKSKIKLAPHDLIIPLDAAKKYQNGLAFYQNTHEVLQLLGEYLFSGKILGEKAFLLSKRRNLLKKYEPKQLNHQSIEVQYRPQTKRFDFKKGQPNIELQKQYFQENQDIFRLNQLMLRADSTLQCLQWRNKKGILLIDFRPRFSEPPGASRIREFITCFPNFYQFDSYNYIRCKNYGNSDVRRQQLSDWMQLVLQSQQIEEQQRKEPEDAFSEIKVQFSKAAVALKDALFSNLGQKKSDRRLMKKLDSHGEQAVEMLDLLKECFVCQKQLSATDTTRKLCKVCFTYLHVSCAEKVKKCFCQQLEFPIPKVQSSSQFKSNYSPVFISDHSNLRRPIFQGIKTFKSKISREEIEQKQKEIIQELRKRDNFFYAYGSMAHRQIASELEICRFYDPLVVDADEELTEEYRKYASGEYKAPVGLKKRDQNFLGIEILEAIPKMTLICEYAADIVPNAYASKLKWKDHIMQYSHGRTSRQELILVPINHSNWGPLINHAEKSNCSTLRIVVQNQIRILIYSLERIPANSEIFINYNGFNNQYPTEGFAELK